MRGQAPALPCHIRAPADRQRNLCATALASGASTQKKWCRSLLTLQVRLVAGLKRVASAVGHPHQRRNSGAGKQGSSGSRSHTPSGSMTERRAVPAGGVGGVGNSGLNTPDTSAMRRSLAVGEAGGSPKKKMLRRVRSQCDPPWTALTCEAARDTQLPLSTSH